VAAAPSTAAIPVDLSRKSRPVTARVKHTTATEDRRLHERLMARDALVFGEIYDRFHATVHGVALRVTSNRAAADDITQSVFADVWGRPQRWDPDRGSLRPWLATLAYHRAVDWLRRERAIRRRDSEALSPTNVSTDVEDAVEARLVAEHVRAALAGLPEEQRRAIRLAYFNARSYREVASDLGVPEGTVKSRIRSGLAQLAKTLQSELAGPGFA
jgi:RNA polymerase sigma factor (sigma-70 family)